VRWRGIRADWLVRCAIEESLEHTVKAFWFHRISNQTVCSNSTRAMQDSTPSIPKTPRPNGVLTISISTSSPPLPALLTHHTLTTLPPTKSPYQPPQRPTKTSPPPTRHTPLLRPRLPPTQWLAHPISIRTDTQYTLPSLTPETLLALEILHHCAERGTQRTCEQWALCADTFGGAEAT